MPKNILRLFIVVLICFLQTVGLFAQRDVKGTIISKDGEQLIAVTVQEEGTTNGTFSDTNGDYKITVNGANPVLIFSYTGYRTQKVAIDTNKVVDIVLLEGIDLDEIVVIGYQSVRKSDLTGAVSSIDAEELAKTGSISLEQSLAGRASGVVVTQNSGTLGAGASIKIRGINSMTGSEPLYVVDGVPLENISAGSISEEGENSGQISPLSMINPEDIESLEILKDASATAIYGSRGSNGVVLVTTKSGRNSKIGEGVISLSTEYGISEVPRLIEVNDGNQFWINRAEAFRNSETAFIGNEAILDSARNGLLPTTNWQESVLRRGYTSNSNLNMSGRTDKLSYTISGNYMNAEGIVKRTDFERISTRINLTADVKSNLKVGVNLNYAIINSQQQSTNTNFTATNGTNSIIQRALRTPPTLGLDATASDQGVEFYTPVQALEANTYENGISQFLGSIFAEYTINDHLKFKTTFSYQGRTIAQRFYQTNVLPLGVSRRGWARTSDLGIKTKTNTNTLTYNRKFGKQRVDVILGQSLEWLDIEGLRTSNYGFANDILLYYAPNTATFSDPDEFTFNSSRLASFFGRYNHNFGRKFLVTLTGRHDGSSKFAANNKWAFFPAAAVAYKLSEEKFIQDIKAISTLKLRVSYGLSGNQAIQPFQSLAQLSAGQVGFGTGGGQEQLSTIYYNTQLANPNLRWETTGQFNIGLDFGFMEDRATATIDYYNKRTSDLLVVGNRIPAQSGFTTYTENLGEMSANGVELGLEINIVNKKKWSWATNIVASVGKTRIVDMNDDFVLSGYNQGWISGGTQRLIIGEEIGAFFGYRTAGISQFSDFQEFQGLTQQESIDLYNTNRNDVFTPVNAVNGLGTQTVRPGEQIYEDLNGDNLINDLDKQIIGYAQPDFSFGVNNTFSFGNFDFSFFIDGQVGQELVNVTNFQLLAFDESQQLTITKDAWTPENQSDVYPRLDLNNSGAPAFLFSDRFIEDGSFIRLQNATLAYNFPRNRLKKAKIKVAQLYVSGTNLYVLTNYTGYNPDVSLTGSSNLQLGHDNAGYPVARTVRFGAKVIF